MSKHTDFFAKNDLSRGIQIYIFESYFPKSISSFLISLNLAQVISEGIFKISEKVWTKKTNIKS